MQSRPYVAQRRERRAVTRAASAGLPAFDAGFLRDPYPAYRALREAGPLHWCEDFFQGAWLVTRHADVERVLRDPRFSSQRTGGWVKRAEGLDAAHGGAYAAARAQGGLDRFQRLFSRAMVFLDAPDHTRLRRAMLGGFHPATIRALAPEIERLADGILDGLDGGQGFDFIEAVARPLPSRVIGLMLGIDRADEAQFIAWSEELAVFIGAVRPEVEQLQRAQRSLLQLVRYFDALIEARRRVPGTDLVSRLVQAEQQGLVRADGELLAQCAMLLFAGHETTRNLLGNGLFTLLSHPGQWAALCAQPDGIGAAVREILRYDSPVQYTGRRVSREIELHGRTLRRGELLIALIGSANRDPARYTDPERFDITRGEGSHLAFGSGPHVCIGAGLSMLEADITLRALMRRWPDLRLADAEPPWNGNAALRGLLRLPVRCADTAAGGEVAEFDMQEGYRPAPAMVSST
ncbi:cytochrome P450 [Thauera sp. SDU_THAU2]|uniref:cytochrome P450 n=1 Tax=Thauera sp. SDU_THAU2 TaxID=3136633 RepID=UPI00311FC2DA